MRGQNKYVPCLAQLVTDLIRVANIAHNLGASKKKIKWRVLEHTHVNKQKILLYQPTTLTRWGLLTECTWQKKVLSGFFLCTAVKQRLHKKYRVFRERRSLGSLICTQKNLSIAVHNLCFVCQGHSHHTKKKKRSDSIQEVSTTDFSGTQVPVEGLDNFCWKQLFLYTPISSIQHKATLKPSNCSYTLY